MMILNNRAFHYDFRLYANELEELIVDQISKVLANNKQLVNPITFCATNSFNVIIEVEANSDLASYCKEWIKAIVNNNYITGYKKNKKNLEGIFPCNISENSNVSTQITFYWDYLKP